MAIITSSDIKTKALPVLLDTEYNTEIELTERTIVKLSNFPKVMVGDNNSVSLVFKAPLEHQGIDLLGTNCVLSYDTTWTDENGVISSGQIDLTNTCIEKEDYLLYTWVLDINQTAKTGKCNFNVNFLMNLEEDPYVNNTNIHTFYNEDINSTNFIQENIEETTLRYWSVATSSADFEIGDTSLSLNSDHNIILPMNLEEELNEIKAIYGDIETLLGGI